MILDSGGWEVNPFIYSAVALYGDEFGVWKLAVVSFSLILLCLCSKFRFVRGYHGHQCHLHWNCVSPAYPVFSSITFESMDALLGRVGRMWSGSITYDSL